MTPNPFLGVVFHWLGGLASGSFYVPYRFVRKWSWETYWLTGGFFSWIIAPWLLGLIMTRDLPAVISEAPGSTLFWTYFFGVLWGMGGLTFGLTMRYLGMSLGMAVALGYTAAFGTLVPPIFHGELYTQDSDHGARADRPLRGVRVHGRNRRGRDGRHVQGTGDVRGAEEGLDQGI